MNEKHKVDFVVLPEDGTINITFQTDGTGQLDFQIKSGGMSPEQIQAVLYGILVAQQQKYVDEYASEDEVNELIKRNSKIDKTLH